MTDQPPSKTAVTFKTFLDAALHWFAFGLRVIPLVPNSKQSAVKWDRWLDALTEDTIKSYWSQNPSHELACIVGEGLVVFDTDSPEAGRALMEIEMEYGCRPLFITKTRRGFHQYFRVAAGAYVKSDSHSTEVHPDRIDVKTGRGMIVLPPSTDKMIYRLYADDIYGLDEVDQDFIDAVFKHNGRQPPRRPDPSAVRVSESAVTDAHLAKIEALLEHISPDRGYDDWIHVLMAVFHESQGSDEGLELADRWSSQGRSYKGTEAVEVKWRSFGLDTANPVTMGTLIKLAKESGADSQAIRSSMNDDFTVCEYEVVSASSPSEQQEESYSASPLAAYSLRGELPNLEGQLLEQKQILGKLVLLGQATVFYGAPNSGKTLVAIHLIIKSSKQGTLDPKQVFYVNMDDNSNGVVEKLRLAEEYGFHMLADHHQDFNVNVFRQAIEEMIGQNTARGVVVVLDTLKKFTNLMDKQKSTEFARLMRQFCLKGGSIIALAHTNKNPSAAGRSVYSGTSDIVDDFDCAYLINPIDQPNDPTHKVVEFSNFKLRGNVAQTAAYKYTVEPGVPYEERLLSVQEIDPDQLAVAKQVADAHIIEGISRCIDEGVVSKMKLADTAAERVGCAKRAALKILEKYTGSDPAHHRWNFKVQERGAKVYHLLTPPSGPTDDPPLS